MSPAATRHGTRPWSPPSHEEVVNALKATCGAVGVLPRDDPAWERLLPLVHELADAASGVPSHGDHPASTAVACRRLAMATRRFATCAPNAADRELVLATAELVVLLAPGPTPPQAPGHTPTPSEPVVSPSSATGRRGRHAGPWPDDAG